MKRVLIVCLLSFYFLRTFSQEGKLFLVCGQYFDTERSLNQILIQSKITGKEDEVRTKYFNSFLYLLESDSLKTIDTLAYYNENNNKKNEVIHSIRLYQDKKVVIIYIRKKLFKSANDSILLKQISFKNPYLVCKYSFLDEPLYKYWTISKNDSVSIISEKVNKNGSTFNNINIPFRKQATIHPDLLNYYISDGQNGLGVDDIYGGWGSKTEKMEIVKTKNTRDSIFQINNTLGVFVMPSYLKLLALDSTINNLTPNNYYNRISISSESLLILPQKAERNGEDWVRSYYFFNKEKKVWVIKKMPGSYPSFRVFGKWLGGAKTYMANKGYDERMNAGVDIPGKKLRNQNFSSYSSPADFRFHKLKIFPTGLLFLYNIDSDKYIEWMAMEEGELQGDSEVLLVDRNVVYYRINDQIFKRHIIDGTVLGEQKLLVKDNRVHSIHWAFISGK